LAIFTHRFLLNKKSIFPGKKQSVAADKKISKFAFFDELNPNRPVTKHSGFKRISVQVHRQRPVKQGVQNNLCTNTPADGDLPGVEEMKIKAVAVGEHHNMRCPPDMRH
jgi:hypothetical protein